MDKDYEAERKLIWSHMGKNEAKPPLAQEFERKTISAHELIQEPSSTSALPAPTSAGQKFKSNPPNRQKRLVLVVKDPEC